MIWKTQQKKRKPHSSIWATHSRFGNDSPCVSIENKYKFLAESAGDKVQLERFYKACKGTQVRSYIYQLQIVN